LDAATFSPEVRVADPKHGDYQANGVLGYAKSRKENPRAVAENYPHPERRGIGFFWPWAVRTLAITPAI